ncbi:MAG: hypothetical protein DWI57_14635, partial [Chloroflexi bacterium]
MNRAICFYADQPRLVQQGEDDEARTGDDKLGHEGKTVAHSQPGGFQPGLGFVVCGLHAHNKIEGLWGSSLDGMAQGFRKFAALRRCHRLIIALRALARKHLKNTLSKHQSKNNADGAD